MSVAPVSLVGMMSLSIDSCFATQLIANPGLEEDGSGPN